MNKLLVVSSLLLLAGLSGCYVQPAPVYGAPPPVVYGSPAPYYYPPGYYAPAPTTVYAAPVSVGIGCCGYWHRR